MNKILLALHGGAGNIDPTLQNEAEIQKRFASMQSILQKAYQDYQQQQIAIDLVQQMVVAMEDDPDFNAGRGSVLTAAGTAELDASIMDGRDKNAGSVAAVTRIKNPILAARAIMDMKRHVMLMGEGAENFSEQQGLELVANDYFITEKRRNEWKKSKGSPNFQTCIDNPGTVGAVAIDVHGNLAAATSTGGKLNQDVGRIGDSPVIGAGTWADNSCCAISATGDGELFIRNVFAHEVAALMRYQGFSIQAACTQALANVETMGGFGGCIAIDKQGNGALCFNSNAMYRGWVETDGTIHMKLFA